MTEAEKRTSAIIDDILADALDGTDLSFTATLFARINDAGLQITEKPQRKPLPDCEGWWWVKFKRQDMGKKWHTQCVLVVGPELNVFVVNDDGYEFIDGLELRCEWAEGPIEVPT